MIWKLERKINLETHLNCQLPMHPKRRVLEGLGDRHIRIFEICVFPDQSDGHFVEKAFLAVKNDD